MWMRLIEPLGRYLAADGLDNAGTSEAIAQSERLTPDIEQPDPGQQPNHRSRVEMLSTQQPVCELMARQ